MGTTPTGRRSATALVAACAILAAALIPGTGSAANPAQAPDAVPGELLVRYEPGLDLAERAAIRTNVGAVLKRPLLLPRVELLRTTGELTVTAAVAALERYPGVAYAEPNHLRRPLGVPDDPRFGGQWSLLNTGQTIDGFPGVAGADMSAPAAWDTATGSKDVKVAVIDSGIGYEHADLSANTWVNPGEETNGLDDDGNGFVDDVRGWDFAGADADPRGNSHGHGVAGVIGAVGDNGRGVSGVNWDVSLVALGVAVEFGTFPADAVADAIVYADRIGADAANMSFGGSSSSETEHAALEAADDTLFVAAAGNSSTNNDTIQDFPCEYELPNVLCVAATNNRDELADFSSYGATSVDLAAPGQGVLAPTQLYREVFRDDFEGAVERWDYDELPDLPNPAKWRRVAESTVGSDGTPSAHLLKDSEQGSYPNNANTTVTLQQPVDLSGEDGCFVSLDSSIDTQSAKDHLRVEAAGSAAGPYSELAKVSGDTPTPWAPVVAQLGAFEGGNVYLRLRLTSDGTTTGDGASIDNVRVACDDPVRSYTFGQGTSFATPQVTGAAALIKSHMPGISVAELRERILRTVDRLPSLEGKVVTGGRLNLERALTADLAPPVASIDSAPTGVRTTRAATLAFSSSEAGSTFECKLDGAGFASCSSPKTYNALADGSHTFAVRALDLSGNVSQPVEASWSVDATAPTVAFSAAPPASTTERSARFAFASPEAGATFECSLDGAPFTSCSSPKVQSDLALGTHSFAVRARDGAGNWTDPPAVMSWTVTEPATEDGREPSPPSDDPSPSGDPGTEPASPGEGDPVLVPPTVEDPESQAFGPPRLALAIPAGQPIRRLLRRGLGTVASIGADCPCQLTHAVRLSRRVARAVGLAPRDQPAATSLRIGRLRLAVSEPGQTKATVRLSRRAAARLARVRRLRLRLEATVEDRYGRSTKTVQRASLIDSDRARR